MGGQASDDDPKKPAGPAYTPVPKQNAQEQRDTIDALFNALQSAKKKHEGQKPDETSLTGEPAPGGAESDKGPTPPETWMSLKRALAMLIGFSLIVGGAIAAISFLKRKMSEEKPVIEIKTPPAPAPKISVPPPQSPPRVHLPPKTGVTGAEDVHPPASPPPKAIIKKPTSRPKDNGPEELFDEVNPIESDTAPKEDDLIERSDEIEDEPPHPAPRKRRPRVEEPELDDESYPLPDEAVEATDA